MIIIAKNFTVKGRKERMAAGKGNRIKELLFTKFTHHKHCFAV